MSQTFSPADSSTLHSSPLATLHETFVEEFTAMVQPLTVDAIRALSAEEIDALCDEAVAFDHWNEFSYDGYDDDSNDDIYPHD